MYVKETGVESMYQLAGKGKLICENSENICELVRRFMGMDTATAFEAGSSFCGTSEVESRVSGGFFAGILLMYQLLAVSTSFTDINGRVS